MKTCCVLMSTYNGKKYVREQIDSILHQKDVKISMLIRDDGSQDGTLDILNEYEKKYSQVKVYVGANCGACGSFFDLMKNVKKQHDYYAFADQDDIWLSDKISHAISILEKDNTKPALYCGAYKLVDSELKPIGNGKSNKVKPSFGNSLVECIYSGCTGVFNKELLELVIRKIPQNAYMHDWWMYMVASAFGKVYCDETPLMYYRQHDKNVLGGNTGKIRQTVKRIRNFKKLCSYVPKQIIEFGQIFENELSREQKLLIKCMTNPKKSPIRRLEIFKQKKIMRCSSFDNFIYKMMFLFWMI